jgi:galactoside 2-L-fucosyltransferase 1/2
VSSPFFVNRFVRKLTNNQINFIQTNVTKTSTITLPIGVHFVAFTTVTNSPSTISTTVTTFPSIPIRTNDDILCDNISDSQSINRNDDNPCERRRCVVLLRKGGGRLGNRMFSFASAYGLARAHNCRLFVSSRSSLDLFGNFQMKTINRTTWLTEDEVKQLKDIRLEETVCTYKPELFRPGAFQNLELIGYWQSYLYFDAYREEIRQIFTAKSQTLTKTADFLTEMLKIECPFCPLLPNNSHEELREAFRTRYNITWIGIHVRLTDFTRLHYSSDENYIRLSMRYYRRRFYPNRVRFLLGSDDKTRCRIMFASEIEQRSIFVLPYQEYPDGDDLLALTLCHHSIATGGTYSFWSAYLTGGQVIHDIRYQAACSRSDYYPSWFLLVGPTTEKKLN